MSAPGGLFQLVRSLLIESGDPFVERFTPHVIEFRGEGRNGPLFLFLTILDESEELIVYSVAPFVADRADYARTVEFLARANHGLTQNTFELNFVSGELRLRTSLFVERPHLSARLLSKLVMCNAGMMDKYLPALASVVLNGALPEEAITRARRPV